MRMKLHKSTRFGDYEIFPIYDIDFTNLSSTGYVQEESNDAVGSHAYKYRQWKTINSNIGLYIPRNIPKVETQEGNIIPFWHRYNNVVDGRYTMPTENLESFAAVEQGIRPDDWGTNPNYVELLRETWISHDVLRPYTNRTISTWSSSTSYYEDTKRTELRMFYTDTGCSFTVTKMSYSRGDGHYMWPRTYSVGLYPHPTMSIRYPANYAYTDPEGRVIDDDYYINDTISVINPSTGYGDWSNYTDGYNCQMVFVHYVQDGTDFYGVAIIQMNNFTEQSEPVAIHVSAWDATFWGTSIISGGESGAGNWGNNTVPTIAGGTFSEHSDDLIPTGLSPYTVTNTINDTEYRITQTIVSRGAFSVYELATTTDLGQSSALAEIYTVLYNTDFLHNYYQSLYNPLSAVLATHLIPAEFISKYNPPASRKLTVSGYSISDKISERFPQQYPEPPKFDLVRPIAKYSFDAVDIEKYTDSYADFAPYTKFILHLPFIGKTEINANYLAHGSLMVEYACDLMSGNVIAYVWTKDDNGSSQYILSASGNCGYNVPMYSMNQDGSAVGKILTSAVQLGAGAIVGSAASMAKGAVGVVSGSIDTMLASKSTEIQGTLGGNNTLISSKQLWLEIIRPKWIENAYYQRLKGIPAEMSNCIADQSQNPNEPSGIPYDGFIKISHIELDNVNCTESERSEIASLLSAGVYIRGEELSQ